MSIDIRETTPGRSPYFFKEYWETKTGKFAHKVKYLFDSTEYDCPTGIITDLLWAEYKLRYQEQLIQSWMPQWVNHCGIRNIKPDSKWDSEPDFPSHLRSFDMDVFYSIRSTYVKLLRVMHLKEAALPYGTLKSLYDSLREDPAWYLRKSLVEECAASGGCCGRKCGCCAKRLRTTIRKGMNGHCSLACKCCQDHQGCVLETPELNEMDQQYKKALESDNPFYFLCIASAYFAPLAQQRYRCDNRQTSAKTENSDTPEKEPGGGSALERPTDDSEMSPPPYESHISETIETEDTNAARSVGTSILRLRHAFPFGRS